MPIFLKNIFVCCCLDSFEGTGPGAVRIPGQVRLPVQQLVALRLRNGHQSSGKQITSLAVAWIDITIEQ